MQNEFSKLQNQTDQALAMPQDMEMPETEYDDDIATNIEAHLNSISDAQKAFLVDNLNPTNITLLGIVNGQEVFDYFMQVYQTTIVPGNPSSEMASAGAMNQNPANPQAKDTPLPPM